MSNLSKVIVGGPIVLNPTVLGEVLKGSCFYMHYDKDKEIAKLFHNNGKSGGRDILEIRNVSHESVTKLAEGMGLKPDFDRDTCCFWSKNLSIIHLYHDGSADAERIRIEAYRLNIECRVVIIKKGPWRLYHGMYEYSPNSWPADVMQVLKRWAEMWGTKDKYQVVQEQVSA